MPGAPFTADPQGWRGAAFPSSAAFQGPAGGASGVTRPVTSGGAARGARPATSRGAAQAAVAGPASASATRRFARRADEVPVARRFIRDALGDHPSSLDAELLACELVTNAVQHATDAAGVTVAVIRFGAMVHVDVIDDGQSGLPYWRDAEGHDEGGRGFHLVNEIAQRWGFLREPDGTCVWFELDLP